MDRFCCVFTVYFYGIISAYSSRYLNSARILVLHVARLLSSLHPPVQKRPLVAHPANPRPSLPPREKRLGGTSTPHLLPRTSKETGRVQVAMPIETERHHGIDALASRISWLNLRHWYESSWLAVHLLTARGWGRPLSIHSARCVNHRGMTGRSIQACTLDSRWPEL